MPRDDVRPDGASGRIGWELGIVSAAAVAITLVMAAPVLWAPSTRLFGTEIVGRNHDPFTVMAQFQHPPPLGWYSQPATDLPGAALARVVGPVAAFNWLVLVSFPLSAVTAYLLARYVTDSPMGSAVAAFAYAFSPFHLAHAAYHVHVAQTQWLPLYLLALWLCLDRPTLARMLLLLGSVAALALSNFYAGFIGGVLTPLALLGYWVCPPRDPARRSLRGLTLTLLPLATAVVAAMLYVHQVAPGVFQASSGLAFPRSDLFRYSAKWWGYLIPSVEHPIAGRWARGLWERHGVGGALLEQQVAVGWSLLSLGAIPLWRWGRGDRESVATRSAPLLGGLALAALLCSLSPERRIDSVTFVRPSAYLYEIAPMFRSYARFGVVVQLMVALLAGAGVAWLARRRTVVRATVLTLLLAFAVVEYAPIPPWRWRDVLPTQAHRWVASQPPPIRLLDCVPAAQASEQSVVWLLGHQVSLLAGPLADCAEPNLGQKLAALDYTHVLVRGARPVVGFEPGRTAPDGLRRLREFPDGWVFAVVAAKPPLFTAEFVDFHPREYGDGTSWRWMPEGGAWRVVNATPAPVRAWLEVELTPFPGARRLETTLNGRPVTSLTVPVGRHLCRIGPLTLTSGHNTLVFKPRDPAVEDPHRQGRARRVISLAVGAWRWKLLGEAEPAPRGDGDPSHQSVPTADRPALGEAGTAAPCRAAIPQTAG